MPVHDLDNVLREKAPHGGSAISVRGNDVKADEGPWSSQGRSGP